MEREENTEDSDDSEGGRGGAENDNDVEHIENAKGNDADDEISDKKPSNKNEKRVYRERKSLLFLIPHLKKKNLTHQQRMLLK